MPIPISIVAGPHNSNPSIHYMNTDHDIDVGSGNLLRFATDFLGLQFHGDCYAHIHVLCHTTYKEFLYDGRLDETLTGRGAPGLDITACAHEIVGRGVLDDVPRRRGVKWLEPGEAVKHEEIEAIECAEGVRLPEGDN